MTSEYNHIGTVAGISESFSEDKTNQDGVWLSSRGEKDSVV